MKPASDLAFPDLVWSHFSRPRFGQFDERVAAAGKAGMQGIGLYIPEYSRLLAEEKRTPHDIRTVLRSNGVVLSDIEVASNWWAIAGAEFEAAQEQQAVAFEMADEFGVRYLQAIGPYNCELAQATEQFGVLCDRAAEHGLLVGIEWLPFTNIKDPRDAAAIVEGAARPNGGYCVDIWHHVRGANDIKMIQELDPARVFSIQVNDGLKKPAGDDYKADCLANRLPPGQGEFEVANFLRVLLEMGVDAPLSLEVCSTDLWAVSADRAAKQSADAMKAVLDEIGLDEIELEES